MVRSKLSVVVSVVSLLVAAGSIVTLLWVPNTSTGNSRVIATSSLGGDSAQSPLPIDSATVKYKQTAEIAVDFKKVAAMALDADDRIYVAGDKSFCRLSPQGKLEMRVPLPYEPTCMTVANRQHVVPERIYVGFVDHVEKYEPDGAAAGVLGQGLGESARCTSLATSDTYIFIADSGQSVVQRFDWTGKLLEPFGESTPGHFTSMVHGAAAPFDLAVGLDDLVYVVNRRDHRVEGYTFQGEMERHWGEASPTVEDFAGPSNPSHLAIMPDGRFVTAEENPLRVKVYGRSGEGVNGIAMESVVCGPESTGPVVAVAADSHKRILVLDGKSRCVRVFERKTPAERKKI